MAIRKPTGTQIKAYRDEHECSMQEAKAALLKEWRMENLTVFRVQCEIGAFASATRGLIDYLISLEE